MSREIIHRARGWHAVFRPAVSSPGLDELPGDTPESLAVLRAFAAADLLPPNSSVTEASQWRCRPCPRCTRLTAVEASKNEDSGVWSFSRPVVCTRCRAEWIQDHPDWIAQWKGSRPPQ